MTVTVNVQDAKTRLSELLKRVEAGEKVTIARNGTPIAQLTPVRGPDFIYGGFDVDVSDDFFAPMIDSELDEIEFGHSADPMR